MVGLHDDLQPDGERKGTLTEIAAIFPFMNWFSVAALSKRSLVNCIGFRALSMSINTGMGIIVATCCAMSSIVPRCPTTSFLQNLGEEN